MCKSQPLPSPLNSLRIKTSVLSRHILAMIMIFKDHSAFRYPSVKGNHGLRKENDSGAIQKNKHVPEMGKIYI